MKKITFSFVKLLIAIVLIATVSLPAFSQGACNCANASLSGVNVGTRWASNAIVNRVVGAGIELPSAGPTLGLPVAPRWNIDFGSNTIRIEFLTSPSSTSGYGGGAAFTFNNLIPLLSGCPPTFINTITVSTSLSTSTFNVITAATFTSNSVRIQIGQNVGTTIWNDHDFILVHLNFSCICAPNCDINMCTQWLTGSSNFGSQPVGSNTTNKLKITNCGPIGSGNLYINPLAIPAPFSFVFDAASTSTLTSPYILAPNQYSIFNVTYTPTAVGLLTKIWKIAQNSTNLVTQNPYPITLTGTGICSGRTLLTTGLTGLWPNLICDFGNVCPGASLTKTFTVKNAPSSCTPLTFSFVGNLASPFTENAATSYTKAPGLSQTITVSLIAPTTLGLITPQSWTVTNNSIVPGTSFDISVKGNVLNPSTVNMSVTGIGLTGTLSTNTALAFGNVSLSSSPQTSTRTITVCNISASCGPNLQIYDWPQFAGPYVVTTTYVSGTDILPNNCVDFTFTFDPDELGDNGTGNWQPWTFTHNATGGIHPSQQTTFNIKLKGTGIN